MRTLLILLTMTAMLGCTKPDAGSETVTVPTPKDLVLEQTNTTTVKLTWTAPSGTYHGKHTLK